MIFRPSPLEGVQVVVTDPMPDERGWFARLWCQQELAGRGWRGGLAQCSLSHNRRAGTLRGLHFQLPPGAEEKLVRCLAGAIFDVALDLRPQSPTYLRWFGVELSPANGCGLLVPPGCAHGFQSLLPDTQVLYFISQPHAPELASGVRWNDPCFAIRWPLPPSEISAADQARPDYRPHAAGRIGGFDG